MFSLQPLYLAALTETLTCGSTALGPMSARGDFVIPITPPARMFIEIVMERNEAHHGVVSRAVDPGAATRRQRGSVLSGIQRQFRSSGERHRTVSPSLVSSHPKAYKTVFFFVSFHRGATQSGILFLVSIERGTSRRVYHRRPWLSDMSQLGGAPCRFLAPWLWHASVCRTDAQVGACRAKIGFNSGLPVIAVQRGYRLYLKNVTPVTSFLVADPVPFTDRRSDWIHRPGPGGGRPRLAPSGRCSPKRGIGRRG